MHCFNYRNCSGIHPYRTRLLNNSIHSVDINFKYKVYIKKIVHYNSIFVLATGLWMKAIISPISKTRIAVTNHSHDYGWTDKNIFNFQWTKSRMFWDYLEIARSEIIFIMWILMFCIDKCYISVSHTFCLQARMSHNSCLSFR